MVKNVGAGSNHYFLLVNHMSLGSLPDYLNFNVPIYKIMVILFHPHRIVFKVTVKLLMPNNAMPYSTVRPLIIIIIVIITMLGDIFPGSFSVIFYLTFLSFFFFLYKGRIVTGYFHPLVCDPWSSSQSDHDPGLIAPQ